MRKLIIILLFLFATTLFLPSQTPIKECVCKDIKLSGYVRIVDSGADFRIRKVGYNANIVLTKYPNTNSRYSSDCGDWTFVSSGESFTIEYVDSGEDFTIELR